MEKLLQKDTLSQVNSDRQIHSLQACNMVQPKAKVQEKIQLYTARKADAEYGSKISVLLDVMLQKKSAGKPYEGELHVRIDEKAEEEMKSNPPFYSTIILMDNLWISLQNKKKIGIDNGRLTIDNEGKKLIAF
eukprot:TRINITY_DN1492_c0_g2_i1.p3 TRINITY_DN1492_c0_g2~~TRINITY_DN1492_c0_g2_i1.p3  ORF type:complete len:133 (-),score=1.88 TRINITY_DN1492_c0_g2_i1:236-634(-)